MRAVAHSTELGVPADRTCSEWQAAAGRCSSYRVRGGGDSKFKKVDEGAAAVIMAAAAADDDAAAGITAALQTPVVCVMSECD